MANLAILKRIPIPAIVDPDRTLHIIKYLERHLLELKSRQSLLLPDLIKDNGTIMIFSDYGGESSTSRYLTYSFLLAARDDMAFWFDESKRLRNIHNLDTPYKEIAFKDLNYGPIGRCLGDWLRLADFVRGLLFTLVVSKRVVSTTGRQDKAVMRELSHTLSEVGLGVWKPPVAEKMIRIIHIVCYWISVLSVNGQKIFWMTDDDAITANEDKVEALGRLFASILTIYTANKYPVLGYAKPFSDSNKACNLNDLLSVPDLAAGAVESLFTIKRLKREPEVKEGTNTVLEWLAHQGIGLKKHAMLVEVRDDGQLHTAMLEFKVIDEKRDVVYIPVWL
jgi:hypothetical protein